MSIELEPTFLEYCGETYHIFTSVCAEHPDQIDFVRVVRLRDVQHKSGFSPNRALHNGLERQAVAVARAQVSALEPRNYVADGVVIDYADSMGVSR